MTIKLTEAEIELLVMENAELHKVLDAVAGKQDLARGISQLATADKYLSQYTRFHNALFANIIKALKAYEAWERKAKNG